VSPNYIVHCADKDQTRNCSAQESAFARAGPNLAASASAKRIQSFNLKAAVWETYS